MLESLLEMKHSLGAPAQTWQMPTWGAAVVAQLQVAQAGVQPPKFQPVQQR